VRVSELTVLHVRFKKKTYKTFTSGKGRVRRRKKKEEEKGLF